MRGVWYGGVAAVALMLGSAVPSHASLMLRLDGGSPLSDGGTGTVTFMGSAGSFSFNVTTGVTTPAIGSAVQPVLDLNSIDITSGTGGILTLELTGTGYVGSGGSATFADAVGGTLSAGTIKISTFMDCGDTPFAETTALTSQSFGSSAFSATQSAPVTACSGAYSLTQLAVLTLPGDALFSGDSALAIPEPSTLTLFGAGLLGLGFGLRRKYLAVVAQT